MPRQRFPHSARAALRATTHSRSAPHSPFLCTIAPRIDRKSTRLNSSHSQISYAVFCLKKKKHSSESHTTHLHPPAHIVDRRILDNERPLSRSQRYNSYSLARRLPIVAHPRRCFVHRRH